MEPIDESHDDKSSHSGKHVGFQSAATKGHDAHIGVKQLSKNSYELHLGFLQVLHHYSVDVVLPRAKLPKKANLDPLQNVKVKVAAAKQTGGDVALTMTVHTLKEGLARERISIQSEAKDDSSKLSLVLLARVLKKNQGTPSLKQGIKVTSVDADVESEASDWTGFK